jgi:serine phosphatase RsbU (regulator of sigma subunit)/anti-sigma regulatory factor (Ser/Thr protein kinase)/anti-anti-sigma regulatory factor
VVFGWSARHQEMQMTGSVDGHFGDREAMAEAFEQSPQIAGVVEGPELRMVAGSAAMFATMEGKELLGVPLRESFAEVVGQQIIDQYEACYRTGEIQVAKEWRTVIDPGGGREPFEFYIDFLLYPWRNGDGSIRGVVASATDVTASVLRRRGAEQAREKAERQYRDAVAIVTDIQEALLPEALPVLPTVDIAAWYLLAGQETRAGGDWFDAVVRPGGRVALVVGDVVGHGVKASAVMGQLRAVLHQRLLEGVGIAEAMVGLDRFAASVSEAHAATACVLEYDPSTGDAEYCTAGHPPPLVVSTSGIHRYLEPSGAGPLATGTTFATARTTLELGELVLLYSDGIVERPGRTPAQNTVELMRIAGDAYLDRAIPDLDPSRDTERVCRQTIELLTRLTGYDDDITLLAAQPVLGPGPFQRVVPASAQQLSDLRDGVGSWLTALAVSDLDRIAVQHALGELVTNSIEHAYADARATDSHEVEVTAELDPDGSLAATVTDTGTWREPVGPVTNRGRGLAMVRTMVDGLVIDRDDHGTRTSIRHRLTRPARLISGDRPSHPTPPSGGAGTLRVDVSEELARVRLVGSLDFASAETARIALTQASRGGAAPVVVDLAGVTLLASAGVRLLHELHRSGQLTLTAPAGSPAQHVLDLVQLPYSVPGS